jgi:hypothetical protein
MQVSLPQKWERVRLAKIKRISGTNGASSDSSFEFTGELRLVFTAQEQGSSVEVAVFQADVQLDSNLLYQIVRVGIPTASEETTPIDAGEASTVGGFIIFRTLDQTDSLNEAFLDAAAPPISGSVESDGDFATPAVYQISDSTPGGTDEDNDFDLLAVSHGTGMLIVSATNAIPNLDSDIQVILGTLNFPFGLDATRASTNPTGITIPKGLFIEFDITAPAGDEPTDDISGTFFPVWINRIVREDASETLAFYLSTFNTSDQPSIVPVEFAKITLERDFEAGTIVAIIPTNNLFNSSDANWHQGFGRGHVVLSSLWGGSTSVVDDFFDSFVPIVDEPAEVLFSKTTARLASFAVSRVPKMAPTIGQSKALKGSKTGVSDPDSTNRYVVEADQGLGERVDFATNTSLPQDRRENEDIERYGYKGSLAHRLVQLVVDSSGDSHDYNNDILPRLKILLGRDPIFGDEWFDGVRKKFFNGQVWIG